MAQNTSAGRAYQPSSGSRSRKKKKRKNRTLLFSIVILGILGAAVLIFQMVFNKRESVMEMRETPISANATFVNTGDGLLYQTDGQIHFFHLNDSKKNYTYGMGASDIRMSGSEDMTVVFNEAQLQVVGEKTPLTFTGFVHEVECGKNHLAILRESPEGIESVLLITREGAQMADLTYDDQYIVDFGFFQTGSEMFWIETLNINTGTPTTTISTYDLSKLASAAASASGTAPTGMMHVQGQLVDDIRITSQSMFVAGTNQIIRYIHAGNKEIYRTMIYGYQTADFSAASGTPTFLLTPRGGDFHSVKIVTLQEEAAPSPVETYLQVPTEGVAAYIMGSRLVVVSRVNVYTYSLTGKLSATASFEQPVDSAVKLNDATLLLSSNGMYYLADVN